MDTIDLLINDANSRLKNTPIGMFKTKIGIHTNVPEVWRHLFTAGERIVLSQCAIHELFLKEFPTMEMLCGATEYAEYQVAEFIASLADKKAIADIEGRIGVNGPALNTVAVAWDILEEKGIRNIPILDVWNKLTGANVQAVDVYCTRGWK